MKEIINMMFAFSENAEAFREPINECIKALESYGPEAYGLFSKLIRANAKLRMEAIEEYMNGGFTKGEAIVLTCNQFDVMEKAIQRGSK